MNRTNRDSWAWTIDQWLPEDYRLAVTIGVGEKGKLDRVKGVKYKVYREGEVGKGDQIYVAEGSWTLSGKHNRMYRCQMLMYT